VSDWKRKAGVILIPGLVVAAAFALGGREKPVITDHAGYPAYRKHCKRCHGTRGDARKASRMAERPVSLLDPAFRDTTGIEGVMEVVRQGRRKMKGYSGKLSEEQIEAVSRYVLALPQRTEDR
jgi:mono/diheme cytochrome c family protein